MRKLIDTRLSAVDVDVDVVVNLDDVVYDVMYPTEFN